MRLAVAGARSRMIGIIPTSPTTFGQKNPDKNLPQQPVALTGHAPVRITLEGGSIGIGDPITISDTVPGAGMKATTSGRIVGYALEPFGEKAARKKKMIEVFVHLEEWTAPRDNIDEKLNALLARIDKLEARNKWPQPD